MGTRLYFGRVAPIEPQQEQVNGGGWSWRYKVRIFDKHTEDKTILPDEELPWAQVLLPVTAGSGAANYSVSPQINQGDTVSISYYDADEQMPVITGILPRTNEVSTADPNNDDAYIPHTGFTENKTKSDSIEPDESNEQSGPQSNPSPNAAKFSSAIGDTTVGANTCDPNEYKTLAIISEMNNLLNQIENFQGDAQQIESFTIGAINRIHALVNPYVGQMFSNLFELLVPILNSGLSALYKAVFAKVLAATGGNVVAARLAAEAALLALRPPIQVLQEAISLIAAQVVSNLLLKVDTLVRDTVDNNDRFNSCVGTQFNGALVNAIIGEVDSKLGPLIDALSIILSGGFSVASNIRSGIDIVKDLAGGLLNASQDANKCRGLVKEYAFGVGPLNTAGDILEDVMNAANTAAGLVSDGERLIADIEDLTSKEQQEFLKDFGDFPFLSVNTGQQSDLDGCLSGAPDTCFGPEVVLFGGKGYGASGRAIVGNYVAATDDRSVSNVQGGVVAVEVLDGGVEYEYPPFVEIRDNCGLGLGAVARSVLGRRGTPQEGKVVRIYIVKPGEGYISNEGEQLFTVGEVEVPNGGSGYVPGIVNDEFGGEYQITVDENGSISEILPINIVQVPTTPSITIPEFSPPIPPGGRTVEIVENGETILVRVDINGNILGPTSRGSGAIIKPILITLPTAEDLLAGNIPDSLSSRVSQEEIQQIIDCVEH